MAISFVLREIMSGNQDRSDIANRAFDQLADMGYVDEDIQTALETIFSLEDMAEAGFFSSGIHSMVFDMYDPKKRIPVELLESNEKDMELQKSFHDLYKGILSPERFELFVEAGDAIDLPDDTIN